MVWFDATQPVRNHGQLGDRAVSLWHPGGDNLAWREVPPYQFHEWDVARAATFPRPTPNPPPLRCADKAPERGHAWRIKVRLLLELCDAVTGRCLTGEEFAG